MVHWPQFKVELLEKKLLSHSTELLRCKWVGGEPFVWRAGQYLELFPQGLDGAALPLSIASSFRGGAEFDLLVSRGGSLAAWQVHNICDARGPFGNFVYEPPAITHVLFLAVGTGLSPVRAMLQKEAEANLGPAVTLIFGARAKDHLLLRDEFETCAQKRERFKYVPVLSQPDSSWLGRRGYVQHHLAEFAPQPESTYVYACGKPAMVEESRLALQVLRVPETQIFSEAF